MRWKKRYANWRTSWPGAAVATFKIVPIYWTVIVESHSLKVFKLRAERVTRFRQIGVTSSEQTEPGGVFPLNPRTGNSAVTDGLVSISRKTGAFFCGFPASKCYKQKPGGVWAQWKMRGVEVMTGGSRAGGEGLLRDDGKEHRGGAVQKNQEINRWRCVCVCVLIHDGGTDIEKFMRMRLKRCISSAAIISNWPTFSHLINQTKENFTLVIHSSCRQR